MKKLLIILFILSLLLNAFLITKPYLLPDIEKQDLQNSLDSCLAVNDSLEGEQMQNGDYFTFQSTNVTINSLEKYHINDGVDLLVHITGSEPCIKNSAYFEYQVLTQQQCYENSLDSIENVFTPELFFIESTPRDTIFHEMNWIQLKFKPEHIGRYYLRGYMHVPANNGEYNISPIETEINVVP